MEISNKGLSDIVSTVLLILLVVVAVVVLWFFLRPAITDAGDAGGISQCLKIDLEPLKCEIDTSNSTSGTKVSVKRNAGKGEIINLKFIFTNPALETFIGEPNNFEGLQELESRTYAGLSKPEYINSSLTIAAVVYDSNGEEYTCIEKSGAVICEDITPPQT